MLTVINTGIFFCFIVGNEQNGLDFNRQVRCSLGFLNYCVLIARSAESQEATAKR